MKLGNVLRGVLLCDRQSYQSQLRLGLFCELGTAITMRKQFLFDANYVGLCLRIGYIAKHWVEDMNNKYIPTMCAVACLILAIWLSGWDI